MDWIKIKTQHMLFSNLSMSEKGMLITIQALAAHLEREPSNEEILKLSGVGRKAFGCLTEKLRMIDGGLTEVLRKVNEDVIKTQRSRATAKERMSNLRTKTPNVRANFGRTSGEVTLTEQIRADKIRADKKINNKKEVFENGFDGIEITDEKVHPLHYNIYKTEVIKSLNKIRDMWPIDRGADVYECFSKIDSNGGISVTTAKDILQAAETFIAFKESKGTSKDYYPNMLKWLGTYDGYVGKSVGDLTKDGANGAVSLREKVQIELEEERKREKEKYGDEYEDFSF